MGKILYIRIDNTPVPQVLENDVEELDCRQINDFCSFVGYAMIEDLKESGGTPYYRLIRPVGQLMMNFKAEDAVQFDAVISLWTDILGEILHKGIPEKATYAIRLPQEYVDWLCRSEDDRFSHVGDHLKKQDSVVPLDAEGLEEDIMSVLRLKIEKYLQGNKDKFDYVVFSNPLIGNGSEVARRLKGAFGNLSFLKLDQLERVYEEKAGENEEHKDNIGIPEEEESKQEYNGHEYVDLGLPSGLKWATCNVGASKPSAYGDYYSWGQISADKYQIVCGQIIGAFVQSLAQNISGNPKYDVARAKWGAGWRLPTKKEAEELVKNCTWKWAKLDGHHGARVTGPNGKSIFLPAAGSRLEKSPYRIGENGLYWTGEGIGIYGASLFFYYEQQVVWERDGKFGGFSVRPVSE